MQNQPPRSRSFNHAPAPRPVRPPRLLIVRFSSFGDIIQALSVPRSFRQAFPQAKVDWLVREDFQQLLRGHPDLDQIHTFNRRQSLFELLRLAWRLASPESGYTHVYDAHRNLRSAFVRAIFRLRPLVHFEKAARLAVRPKNRWRRFLYFKFRLKTLPHPFRGAESFLWPLASWGLSTEVPPAPLFFTEAPLPAGILTQLEKRRTSPLVALVPSAAWEMKRWPAEHFCELIRLWPSARFVLLGGPEDLFLEQIQRCAPERVLNLAGPLKLAQSCEILKFVDLVIANDTGLLHVADQLGRPTLALIGPSAFGYPSQKTSRTCEIELPCKPCSKDGRGRCVNSLYKRCLVELTPENVLSQARRLLQANKGPA